MISFHERLHLQKQLLFHHDNNSSRSYSPGRLLLYDRSRDFSPRNATLLKVSKLVHGRRFGFLAGRRFLQGLCKRPVHAGVPRALRKTWARSSLAPPRANGQGRCTLAPNERTTVAASETRRAGWFRDRARKDSLRRSHVTALTGIHDRSSNSFRGKYYSVATFLLVHSIFFFLSLCFDFTWRCSRKKSTCSCFSRKINEGRNRHFLKFNVS